MFASLFKYNTAISTIPVCTYSCATRIACVYYVACCVVLAEAFRFSYCRWLVRGGVLVKELRRLFVLTWVLPSGLVGC